MPGYREVFRCAQCGYVVSGEVGGDSKCLRCGTDLHACAQCASFDPGSRFECMQPVPARVTPKNARNTCASFSPRTTVERETTTPQSGQLAQGIRRSLQVLMSLLSERDRQTVQTHLAGLTHDVTLLFFTQTIGAPETALIARQVMDEVAGLSDRVSVEEVNLILDREKSAQFGIDRIPAIVLLRDGADTRMRFLGAPAGYEFSSLIESIMLAGTEIQG